MALDEAVVHARVTRHGAHHRPSDEMCEGDFGPVNAGLVAVDDLPVLLQKLDRNGARRGGRRDGDALGHVGGDLGGNAHQGVYVGRVRVAQG